MEKGKLWMMIIIIILALMCVGFVVGFIVLTNTLKGLQSDPDGSTRNEVVAQKISEVDIEDVDIGDQLTSNLKRGDDGRDDHLILLSLQVGLNKTDEKYEDMAPVIKEKTFAIKDLATSILRAKTYEELQMDNAQELLKDEILTKLQDYFQTNVIVQVNLVFITQ